MHSLTHIRLSFVALLMLMTSCALSPETLAKIDAYNNSIPICLSAQDCDQKWQTARSWAIEHADFPILTESENRIMASSTLTTNSGVGVVVIREARAAGLDGYQLLVNVECFSAYGCPDIWDLKLDFNRALANR